MLKKIIRTLISCCLLTSVCLKAETGQLIIKNATLISPERQTALKNAYIKIEKGLITEVSSQPIEVGDFPVLDATDRYLIPGIMDSHVHVSSMPGIPQDLSNEKHQRLHTLFVQQQPKSYLYFGVTQLLDPSQLPGGIESFNANAIKPDLFHCGAVPILGGYPTLFVEQHQAANLFKYFIYQPTNDENKPVQFDIERHTPEAVVERIANDGHRCVKLFLEDGFGELSSWPMVSNDIIKRVKRAAKQHELIVMAHANAIDMQELATHHQIDVIAHGLWNWNQFASASGLPDQIKSVLDEVMLQKQIFQPTLGVMNALKGVLLKDPLSDERYQKVIPKEIFQWYHTEDGRWFQKQLQKEYGGLPVNKILQRTDRIISQGERAVQYLIENNYPLVIASDTPPAPTYAAQPGYSTYQEMLHLNRLGLSLKQVLEAATVNNAKAFRLEHQYGTIEPGKVANLLLLNSNPLDHISAYDDIQFVILKGQPLLRESLKAN